MQHGRVGWLFGLVVLLLTATGCGDGGNTALVTGTVTLDGQPVQAGMLLFVPIDGQSPTAGGEIKDGYYSARVPITTMRVSISAPRVVGTKKIYDTPDSPEMPITEEALPARYNEETELKIEVKRGTNQRDFELHSK